MFSAPDLPAASTSRCHETCRGKRGKGKRER
jgi:hypothetical protein